MDAGGVTREWYTILSKEMFNINYALFNTTYSNVFQPNQQSYINPDHLAYFKFIGRILGKAICDQIQLDVHFTRSFYKHILNQVIVYSDLETTDPEYYKSLQIIIQYDMSDLGLDLTFSTETYEFGKVVIKDLVANGRHVHVDESNKHEYVKLIANHRMATAIEKQARKL
jgi:E3 ubiquitin-protein ligase HUWE1